MVFLLFEITAYLFYPCRFDFFFCILNFTTWISSGKLRIILVTFAAVADRCTDARLVRFPAISQQEESQSTPALIHVSEFSSETCSASLGIIPENNLLESYTRLSISLEENGLFKVRRLFCIVSRPLYLTQRTLYFQGSSRSSSSSVTTSHQMTLEELRAVNRYAESTKSLSYLPQVRLTGRALL